MYYLICINSNCNNRFEISRKLGQGTYGKVQLGINKETGQQVRKIKSILEYFQQ